MFVAMSQEANLDHPSNWMLEAQLVSYSSLILLPFHFSKQTENKIGSLIILLLCKKDSCYILNYCSFYYLFIMEVFTKTLKQCFSFNSLFFSSFPFYFLIVYFVIRNSGFDYHLHNKC